MALIHADFVEETTATTGTGTLSLDGATAGHRTFASSIGAGNTCVYAIASSDGFFESGIGTIASGTPDTLARTTLLSSSTGSKLDLIAGEHRVYCTFAAQGGDKAYSAISSALAAGHILYGDTNGVATTILPADIGLSPPALTWVGDQIAIGGSVTGPHLTGPQGAQGIPGERGDPGAQAAGTYIVSGATVSWVSGYTYRIGAATYYIDGVLYSSAEQSITLGAADSTFDRIDVIVLNSSLTVTAISGDLSSAPAYPAVDLAVYCTVTFCYVTAASSSAPVTTTNMYLEGTEWTFSASAGTIVGGSTDTPRTGTKCIKGTSVASNTYMTLVSASVFDMSKQNGLVLYIRLGAAWPTTRNITLRWYNSTTARGAQITIANGTNGFNSQLIGSYQQIVLPVSLFSIPSGTLVDRLRMTFAGTGTSIGFWLDDIVLQAGTAVGNPSDHVLWRGTWGASVSYMANDIVLYGNVAFMALTSNTNVVPGSNTAIWGILWNQGSISNAAQVLVATAFGAL